MAAIVEVAQETAISEGATLRERLQCTAEALETRISTTRTRIHKFPHRLRGIGGADNCHVVPSMVAIGPYHHGLAHLQEMEEVKQAAAHRLCGKSGRSVEEVYEKIVSVSGDARRCYDASLVACLSDAEFATMMFVDACFLVWYVAAGLSDGDDKLFTGLVLSSRPNIEKDIFMLENQIPWLVLQAIVEITNNNPVGLRVSDSRLRDIRPRNEEKKTQWRRLCFPDPTTDNDDGRRGDDTDSIIRRYTPAHLLGLLRFSLICSMPREKRESQFNFHNAGPLTTWCRTAFDLAQAGIKLAASKARWFADMNCVKKPLVFGELSLSPLYLTDVTTCWLMSIVYNNYRSIVALMSIVSVLVGIFKAIYSLKKP